MKKMCAKEKNRAEKEKGRMCGISKEGLTK
jgi:hypothetical protein